MFKPYRVYLVLIFLHFPSNFLLCQFEIKSLLVCVKETIGQYHACCSGLIAPSPVPNKCAITDHICEMFADKNAVVVYYDMSVSADPHLLLLKLPLKNIDIIKFCKSS